MSALNRLADRLTGWSQRTEARMRAVEASTARVEQGLRDLNSHLAAMTEDAPQ